MRPYEIVEIKEDILSRSNAGAASMRESLVRRGVLYVNVMASPGSGKTTLLTQLIRLLEGEARIGVIEADIDGSEDAEAISRETGARTIQMHTGGACHITWQMSREALEALGTDGLDIVFLENVGNLVCPAEFDTGASVNLVLLSVPEGDDKPLKYPLMFEQATAVVLTKIDTLPAFGDFSIERAKDNIHMRQEEIPVFAACALDGRGVGEVADFLLDRLAAVRAEAGQKE